MKIFGLMYEGKFLNQAHISCSISPLEITFMWTQYVHVCVHTLKAINNYLQYVKYNLNNLLTVVDTAFLSLLWQEFMMRFVTKAMFHWKYEDYQWQVLYSKTESSVTYLIGY